MSIILKNVTFKYDAGAGQSGFALRDVSLEIDPGKIYGIIGHTGSGKSTLIQLMNGLLTPESGTVTVDGRDFSDRQSRAELRRKVGLVFQYPEYQLFEETLAEDIAFGPKNLGMSQDEIRERVRESAAMVGLDLEELGDRSPFELSGGQKRKAAIAGILAMHPEYLVMDEPAAGLDPRAHREMIDMLRRIRDRWGTGIVIVSHSMDDVASLCDRVFVMNAGSPVISGTPAEVFGRGEELRKLGLGLPAAAELMRELRARGIELSDAAQELPLDAGTAAAAIAELLRL